MLTTRAGGTQKTRPVMDTLGQVDINNFESLKNKGNDFFRRRAYDRALIYYTKAIEADKQATAGYTNRAICFIHLGKYSEASRDCDRAIELDSSNVKAYYRRATASKNLHRYRLARRDFERLAELDETQSKLARSEIGEIDKLLGKDERCDILICDKPAELRSDKPLKTFELKSTINACELRYC